MWNQRLGHLNNHSRELMNRKNGNGVSFDGSIADNDVCALGKSHQLAHSKKAKHDTISATSQLVYRDLVDLVIKERPVSSR